jgi:hypothetical protein
MVHGTATFSVSRISARHNDTLAPVPKRTTRKRRARLPGDASRVPDSSHANPRVTGTTRMNAATTFTTARDSPVVTPER